MGWNRLAAQYLPGKRLPDLLDGHTVSHVVILGIREGMEEIWISKLSKPGTLAALGILAPRPPYHPRMILSSEVMIGNFWEAQLALVFATQVSHRRGAEHLPCPRCLLR